jgi:hypothetical protein
VLSNRAHLFLRAVTKDHRHPIGRRQPDQLLVRRIAYLGRRQDNFNQLAQALLLLLDQQFGVSDQIDEEHMLDLKATSSGSMVTTALPRTARKDDFSQLAQALPLLLDQELGITDQIDEQHMPDFEAKILLGFSRHSSSCLYGYLSSQSF